MSKETSGLQNTRHKFIEPNYRKKRIQAYLRERDVHTTVDGDAPVIRYLTESETRVARAMVEQEGRVRKPLLGRAERTKKYH